MTKSKSLDNARKRDWEKRNPEKFKAQQRRSWLKRYGLTEEDFRKMEIRQKDRCAICRRSKKTFKSKGKVGGRYNVFHVDHCHRTGKVRGLLCWQCNNGLGMFLDSTKNLQNAISYLRGTTK